MDNDLVELADRLCVLRTRRPTAFSGSARQRWSTLIAEMRVDGGQLLGMPLAASNDSHVGELCLL